MNSRLCLSYFLFTHASIVGFPFNSLEEVLHPLLPKYKDLNKFKASTGRMLMVRCVICKRKRYFPCFLLTPRMRSCFFCKANPLITEGDECGLKSQDMKLNDMLYVNMDDKNIMLVSGSFYARRM